ncbi:hypothetical protein E2C01_053304 [Portunus trituberculatus]|uniref:Uncharacterized protein n=1 Tax=Portunus trituberculatus TaxID=210409 RepID=A0A5B7GNV1_PORTR|nr:hypothetical protein [Portunus trituberculatus]
MYPEFLPFSSSAGDSSTNQNNNNLIRSCHLAANLRHVATCYLGLKSPCHSSLTTCHLLFATCNVPPWCENDLIQCYLTMRSNFKFMIITKHINTLTVLVT